LGIKHFVSKSASTQVLRQKMYKLDHEFPTTHSIPHFKTHLKFLDSLRIDFPYRQ